MQSFTEKAKKVIRENQDLFNVLEELDRTGAYRKASYKKRVNFTVDEELFNRFRSYCEKKGIKMSARIEECMRKQLEQA